MHPVTATGAEQGPAFANADGAVHRAGIAQLRAAVAVARAFGRTVVEEILEHQRVGSGIDGRRDLRGQPVQPDVIDVHEARTAAIDADAQPGDISQIDAERGRINIPLLPHCLRQHIGRTGRLHEDGAIPPMRMWPCSGVKSDWEFVGDAVWKDSEDLPRTTNRLGGDGLVIRLILCSGSLRMQLTERNHTKRPGLRLGLLRRDAYQEQEHHEHRQDYLVHSLHHPNKAYASIVPEEGSGINGGYHNFGSPWRKSEAMERRPCRTRFLGTLRQIFLRP